MVRTLSRVAASQMEAMRGDPSVADQLLHEPLPAVPVRPALLRMRTAQAATDEKKATRLPAAWLFQWMRHRSRIG